MNREGNVMIAVSSKRGKCGSVAIDVRREHEIQFSACINKEGAEQVWGWGTPAGKIRAGYRARRIIEGTDLRQGMRVLEVGCGTGVFTEFFAATGAHIVALDISGDLLEKARGRGLQSNRVTFREGQFETVDIEGPFDAVIGSSVLHHLEVEKAFGKMRRLLKPGGSVCFTEPNMISPYVFLERNLRALKIFPYVSPDETAFIRRGIKSLLSRMGFIDVRAEPFDWLPSAAPAALINPIVKIGCFLERTPLVREFAGSLYLYARLS